MGLDKSQQVSDLLLTEDIELYPRSEGDMISLTSLDSLFKVICKSYWFKPSKIFQISNQATFLWINPESSDDFFINGNNSLCELSWKTTVGKC